MPASNGPILIVEDVPNVLELLEVTLKFKGYAVLTARDGEEALDVLKTQRPMLIITDILMPKMDGYAFVQKLRFSTSSFHRYYSRWPTLNYQLGFEGEVFANGKLQRY